MFTIRNFTDTKCELEVAKTRLNFLMDKKERLYCKYFPITPTLKKVMVDGGEKNNDKMADYLHELHEIDLGTGKSLAEEITYQQQNIDKLQGYLNNMSDSLSKMTGIEYKLYYEIVVKGVNISKAVGNIANETGKDTSTIWKNYYSKIKKDIKKVNNFTKV
jgi:hypothetical protein|nr:MAG TPA: hypothetical protein [Caudoviricetes sp.]